jgi:hypothetical protein
MIIHPLIIILDPPHPHPHQHTREHCFADIDPCYTFVLQLGDKFLRERGFKHVRFLSADGALESYPPVRLLSLH